MKKFLLKTFLFILLFFSLSLLLLFGIKPSKAYTYSYPTDGCKGRNKFIYEKIIDQKNYDILFIGSSHTMNAINDSIITFNTKQQSLNLGLCGLGKNKEYMILKDWIQQHEQTLPKKIFIECNHWENTYSYNNYGYMADANDIVDGMFLWNRSMHMDFVNALKVRIDYIYETENKFSVDTDKYGFLLNPMQLDHEIAKQKKNARVKKWEKEKQNLLGSLEFSYPNYYVQKIAKLCNKNNIQLYFLYLPSYGWPTKQPMHTKFLAQYGPVVILPSSIDEQLNLWADDEHHNRLGAEKISNELNLYLLKE